MSLPVSRREPGAQNSKEDEPHVCDPFTCNTKRVEDANEEWQRRVEWHRLKSLYGIGRYVEFGWANV
jgi:hypothetical protein